MPPVENAPDIIRLQRYSINSCHSRRSGYSVFDSRYVIPSARWKTSSAKNKYEIEKELNLIGFHNIKLVEDKYSEGDFAEDDITRVVVNERSDFNKWQYWKKDAQIIISYHVYAISIGESSEELKGQNYLDVKGKLKRLGFNNIEETEIVEENGWGKPFGIVSISVNGEDSFEKNAKYKPNDRIIITYSSGDREDVTSVVKNWKSQKYQALLKD